MEAIFCVGVSGSGKSTWAKNECPNHFIIERDICRQEILRSQGWDGKDSMWLHWKFSRKNESLVDDIINKQIEFCVANKKNIIFSSTNLNKERLFEAQKSMRELGYEIKTQFFPVDYDEAVKRDRARKHSVGESVIRKQWLQWLQFDSKDIGIRKYEQVSGAKKAIIVDIDGTISHTGGKRGFFEWDKVHGDVPIPHTINLVSMFAREGYQIIFMSGRDSICRQITEEWIKKNIPVFNDIPYEIYMRAMNDMRKDSIIKEELFYNHVAGRFFIEFVMDDRKQVVRMWNDIGLNVLDVGNHYEDF